jgi:WD40 repeat protein
MLAAGYFDNTVKLWDIPTGSEKLTLRGHIGPVYCVAFSPDGTWMASGANDEQFGALTIYDAASGRMRREGRVPFLVTCLAFDPNGDALAVGSHDYLDSAVRI